MPPICGRTSRGNAMTIYLLIAASYLLGSIPFGVLLTRAFGAGDLRQIGSGSIGATNVLRTGRKGLAAATVLLDGAKGAVAVLLARHFLPEQMGRASWRERVCQYAVILVVDGSLKK